MRRNSENGNVGRCRNQMSTKPMHQDAAVLTSDSNYPLGGARRGAINLHPTTQSNSGVKTWID